MITPPPRTVLGNLSRTGSSNVRGSGVLSRALRHGYLASVLCALTVVACGDPNNPEATTGTLAGVVRDAETDAPIEGVTLVVAGIQGQTGSDGRFELDSVPEGTQQVAATRSGYVARTIEVQIQASATGEIIVELVPDLGPPGPSGVVATTDDAIPGTVRVSWEPVDGATSYVVYWGTLSPVDPVQGVRVAEAPNPFIHTELSAGTTYYYVVTASGPEGESRPSSQVSATPDGSIAIQFVNPIPNQIVGARFVVSVEITSVFQLTSVTAQVGEFTDDLTYHPESDEWEGFFEVGDTPSPSFQTVHYTATDAAGNIARTAVLVRLDRLPVVTLSSPQDDGLAAPSLRVVATCADDNAAGCESLTISVSDGLRTITKAMAQASVDQAISLAEFDGQVVDLRAGGRDIVQDRIHRTTGVLRTVYVDASPHLTPVASSGTGTLIDANATDLLTVDGFRFNGSDTDTLRLVNRVSGQSTVLHNVLHEQARVGALFPGGAIFFTRSQPVGSVREWRNGTSSVLAIEVSDGSLKVNGPYAIWSSSGGLIQRELTTGTNVTVIGGPTGGDVAATGEVAWSSSSPYEIFLFQGGMNTQLTNDGDGEFANTSPVTDGIHVVYERRALFPAPTNSSIRLSAPGSEITLASNITRDLEPGEGYQVNDGWIAFLRPDAASSRQVWRRSAAGVETQVSAFGSSSRIESMGPAGEIVFTSEATGTPRRYRALVGGSPTDIGSTLGRPVFIDGQLHVMMGATLLQVD
jgi:carboxypeptidase family protein